MENLTTEREWSSVFAQSLRRLSRSNSPALWIAVLATPFLAVVHVVHSWHGRSIGYLTRDPAAIGHMEFYAGFLSNVGVVFWCVAATVCLFCGALLSSAHGRPERSFLLASGLLTALLAMDDLFMLHEAFFPKVLGIPERAVHAAYATLVLWYVWRFRAIAFADQGRLLMLAMLLLASSMAIDVLGLDRYVLILEDGFKFVGIATWLVFFVRFAWQAVHRPLA